MAWGEGDGGEEDKSGAREKKASTSPSFAGFVFFASSSAVVAGFAPGVADGPLRPEPMRSSFSSEATGMHRKSFAAFSST